MLALPSRSRPCLLCSFQALSVRPLNRRTSEPQIQRRNYTSSSSLLREKPAKVSHRPLKSASPKVSPSSEQVASRILHNALPRLKSQLQKKKASADSKLTQLASLDPSGNEWISFTKRLEDLLDGPEAARSKEDLTLLSSIGRAAVAPEWSKELVYMLHYAFIDHVLESRRKADDAAGKTVSTDLRYPTEWYAGARQIQREVHLHVGPTNSGKTYNALKRLEEKASGFYAGPLRLLAHEVYSRFKAKGVPCDLVTGDDVRLDDSLNVNLSASTVEMVDTAKRVEIAVIDEIQMIESQDRGWAWTRAFLGANAAEVHLCGETRVIPLIRELTASMGDTLHIHEYQRLNPLKVMSKSLNGDFKTLKKGDCVVSFSIVTIHALKKQIEVDTGRRCAIVYGSLPPETRAQQAALFNDPNNDYDFLVASDAIGMGLNLSVKRIIFHSVVKWNGRFLERLSVPQIKQIAGRAGRFRSANQNTSDATNTKTPAPLSVGLVTTLHEADLQVVKEAMAEEAPPIKTAGILPPGDYLEEVGARMPGGIPFEYLMRRVCSVAEMHPRFSVCDIRDQSLLSRVIEDIEGLTIAQRLTLTAAPASTSTNRLLAVYKALATAIGQRREVTVVDVPEIELEVLDTDLSGDRSYLEKLENLHKSLILYLWLSYRFAHVFKDRDMAVYAKDLTEERINICLLAFSANPALRKRAIEKTRRHIYGSTTQAAEGTDNLSLPGIGNPALPIDWSQGSSNLEISPSKADVQHVATTA